jgi:hypothetical protein
MSGIALLCKKLNALLKSTGILHLRFLDSIEEKYNFFIVGAFFVLFIIFNNGIEEVLIVIPYNWGHHDEFGDWISVKSVISGSLAVIISFLLLIEKGGLEIRCPFCKNPIVPENLSASECKHTIFIYANSPYDDLAGFKFVQYDFARLYLTALRPSKYSKNNTDVSIDLEDLRYHKKLIDEILLPHKAKILSIEEREQKHKKKVVAAFASNLDVFSN